MEPGRDRQSHRERQAHQERPSYEDGRLRAVPRPAASGLAPTGRRKLPLPGARDGLLLVPAGYRDDRPAPLALLLHGAGGNPQQAIDLLAWLSDALGAILVATQSQASTWDVLVSGFGPDVRGIDEALATVFRQYAVDPACVAIGGFSDGASYALSLGLGNGDLFRHVLAFSPGFAAPPPPLGKPRIFISHGVRDTVLPIDRCSRRLVPALRRAGYDVTYHEFDGGHGVPPEVGRAAVSWFTG